MRNVTAGYGKGTAAVKVLRDVNIAVRRGHTVGVIGESGCGKSTLARVMSGLLPASEGEVLLDGEELQPSFRQRDRDQLRKVSPFLLREIFLQIQERLCRVFPRVDPYFGPAPIYGCGIWSWTCASRGIDPMAIVDARAERIEAQSRYYNRDIHRGAFALPNDLRRRVGDRKMHEGTARYCPGGVDKLPRRSAMGL